MQIGQLGRALGVPVETIRYYEREGLLPRAERSTSNYRVYGEAHADRLRFIVNCRALDMTLDEVRSLLDYHDAPSKDCTRVNELLDEHIAQVATRIAELHRLEGQLQRLRKACRRGKASGHCGILRSLRQRPAAPK
ncbi:Cd(II)/Pb(II)-responsive transcriptional regulator [Sinimarinibacterium thermocellulolyticum]|jgi:Cd(II)/Pb(II)-responsive transcriptional regulator|uniref:Cd(II)/Pb(II)-responsive transcriptional regulator n=1 Tax=Sinimarinibacterium thermocellulolyticum TaxID=3170016 RepID=A0ABV2AF92_9GAMM